MRQAALLLLILATLVAAAPPGAVDEAQVREIAAQLRCVVCQNLSVADSPSAMAAQMRGIIRERLAAGESAEQVIAYFENKYGEWILLLPKPHGFNLLVWVVPFVGIAFGLGGIAVLSVRWARRRPVAAPEAVDPAIRDRIRREIADLDS